MADEEESPAQRQARIRREKREAKIRAGGSERLDKITRLSGRTPEQSNGLSTHRRDNLLISVVRDESPSSPPPLTSPSFPPSSTDPPSPPIVLPSSPGQFRDPSQSQAQQDFFRNMMRAAPPDHQQQSNDNEDPMQKMMSQLMGGLNQDGASPDQPMFSPEQLTKATGLPSFVSNMLLGKGQAPPTNAELQMAKVWRIIHTVFALIAGVYTVYILERSVSLFGIQPPAPATVRNPFLIFTTGEVLIQGSKAVSSGASAKRGLGLGYQIFKDLASDGCIVIFVLGAWNWWHGTLAT